jgi:hypothetical protein
MSGFPIGVSTGSSKAWCGFGMQVEEKGQKAQGPGPSLAARQREHERPECDQQYLRYSSATEVEKFDTADPGCDGLKRSWMAIIAGC